MDSLLSPAAVWPLARTAGAVFAAPLCCELLGVRVRILLAVLIGAALVPCLPPVVVPRWVEPAEWLGGTLAELGFGLLLGWTGSLLVIAARCAGMWEWRELSGSEASLENLWPEFRAGLAAVTYLVIDGPATFLAGLRATFASVPAGLGVGRVPLPVLGLVVAASKSLMLLVLPMAVVVLMSSLSIGVVQRMVGVAGWEDRSVRAALIPLALFASLDAALVVLENESIRLGELWISVWT